MFCEEILGKPELAEDPRYLRNSLRVENAGDLRDEIERAFLGSTAPDVAAKLEQAGIANALLRDMHGLAAHPQLKARGRWKTYESPKGTLRALVPPVTMDGLDPVMGPVPDVGEHTTAVLAEFGIVAAAEQARA